MLFSLRIIRPPVSTASDGTLRDVSRRPAAVQPADVDGVHAAAGACGLPDDASKRGFQLLGDEAVREEDDRLRTRNAREAGCEAVQRVQRLHRRAMRVGDEPPGLLRQLHVGRRPPARIRILGAGTQDGAVERILLVPGDPEGLVLVDDLRPLARQLERPVPRVVGRPGVSHRGGQLRADARQPVVRHLVADDDAAHVAVFEARGEELVERFARAVEPAARREVIEVEEEDPGLPGALGRRDFRTRRAGLQSGLSGGS
jgi:hypothetical protein